MEMAVIEDDHVVKTFSTDGAHKAFRIGILPGRLRCREDVLDAEAADPMAKLVTIDPVAVADHVPGRGVLGEGFVRISDHREREDRSIVNG
jgi:hypothetical protein